MIKTDDLYLENLKELLYDDKRIVTYKFLSVFLGVHVNLAKQMLYTFYEKEKKTNKKLSALFYVSGLVREKGIAAAESDSPVDETEKQVVMLCRDSDYPEIIKNFDKLYSVHIYCLSSDPVPDASVLSPILGDIVKLGGKEKSAIEYGPFSLNAEVKPARVNQPVTNKTPQPIVKKEENKSTDNASKSTDKASKSSEKAPKPASNGKDEAKTKHFFVSQATNGARNKSPSKNNSTKSKSGASQSSLAASFSKAKPPKPKEKIEKEPVGKEVKKKFKSTQGRKRIRIESDSGSDDDDRSAKKHHSEFSSSDEDSDFEERSHPLRIDSDPEEEEEGEREVEQEKSHSAEEHKLSDKATCRDGRKRTLKTVVKTYEDEDGFVVTEKKQEFVSESDGEGEVEISMEIDTKSNARSKAGEEVAKAGAQKEQSSSNNDGAKKKASAPKGNGTAGGSQPKSKQASIMSFFHKKS